MKKCFHKFPISRNPVETQQLWAQVQQEPLLVEYCKTNNIDIRNIGTSQIKKLISKIKKKSKLHLGVISDWLACSTIYVFGIAILHMNMNGLRVLLRALTLHAIRIHRICRDDPSQISFYFQLHNEARDKPIKILTREEILGHLSKCLKQRNTYLENTDHLILKQHGKTTRYHYKNISRFLECKCDGCVYRPFEFSQTEILLKLLLLSWLEIIRPWNIVDDAEFRTYCEKYLMQTEYYQTYCENFKSIWICLFGTENYTRYFLAATDGGGFYILLAYRLGVTAASIWGEHAVEALNNSVKCL